MDLLSKEDVKGLIEMSGRVGVSLYMPTYRGGPETRQNTIRFKNQLKNAEAQLGELDLQETEVRNLLEPGRRLETDENFWRNQGDGLAVFLAEGLFLTYRLPVSFEELVVVTEHFHVKPLLQFLGADSRFYVLALSQNEVRFFQCTRQYINLIEIESVPSSLAEALKYDEQEKQLQFHTGAQQGAAQPGPPGSRASGGGKRPAIFHGHGVGKDDNKDRISQYFRQIDQGLREVLHDESAPLILVGVDYLLPIYREANTYPYLLDAAIEGNPDHLRADQVHERAWNVMEPQHREEQQRVRSWYQDLVGTGKTADDLKEIVPAAYHGRVDSLFAAAGVQRWGEFDPSEGRVVAHDAAQPGDKDLVDLATAYAFVNGGRIYVVQQEDIPGGAAAAAVFRY